MRTAKGPGSRIYSLAIVSTALLAGSTSSPERALVSMQTHSGLRQSYFREGSSDQPLAKMPRLGTVPFARIS